MTDDSVVNFKRPEELVDPLTQLLREGAREFLAKAVEAELHSFLTTDQDHQVDGKAAIIRNGYLPERTIQTGLADVDVKIPKYRDRSGQGIKFNSALIPPYLKRSKSVEEFLPWLYIKGVSTGDFQDTRCVLLGEHAKGLSSATISRLKSEWESEYKSWNVRRLDLKHYVYLWADGIYFNVRKDDNKTCILVIIAVTERGQKELIAIEDGYRESEQSWLEVLHDIKSRGLTVSPKLAVGDGALGFWNALDKVYPQTRHQRCWVHKTANILTKMPKSVPPKAKEAIHNIWMAETREMAEKAFDAFVSRFEAKYPKAVECLVRDKEKLLIFYDFPAEHWAPIRTTNPIESTFAAVRHRTNKTKNCVSRISILTLAFKLVKCAEKRWNKLRGFKLLADVIDGVPFKEGIKEIEESIQGAA